MISCICNAPIAWLSFLICLFDLVHNHPLVSILSIGILLNRLYNVGEIIGASIHATVIQIGTDVFCKYNHLRTQIVLVNVQSEDTFIIWNLVLLRVLIFHITTTLRLISTALSSFWAIFLWLTSPKRIGV